MVAGGATLAVALGFLAYLVQSTGLGLAGDGYELSASFQSAQGVDAGSDVRLAGVRVGRVTEMALNPETFRADMALMIEAGIELPEDSTVAISSEGLLGGTFVEILPGESPFLLEPGMSFEETKGALSLLGLLAQTVTEASRD